MRAAAGCVVLAAVALAASTAPAEAVAADGIVRDGNARFQILSPTLIRLEYSTAGTFEDRSTMLAFDRRIDPPRYAAEVARGRLNIVTDRMVVSYERGSGPFRDDNLTVTVRLGDKTVAAKPRWQPPAYSPPLEGFTVFGYFGAQPDRSGPRTRGNLGGWTRGLDSQSEPRVLHDGLLSRDGWFFIDDSRSVVLTGESFAPRPPREGPYQDGYLFGYGHDYAKALADYRLLSGPAPLLPRKAFGVWFSRYFPYTEADYRERLLPSFRRERVPLDVLVVDTEFRAPQPWNGWNWNPALFPDPARFLRWAHGEGLDVTFNAHPSIALSDPRFGKANADAGGLIGPAIGPAVSGTASGPGALTDVYFTFDFANPKHLASYFALHKPFERDGADFWWLDWCCEEARTGPLIPDGTVSGDAWINSRYALRSAARGKRWLNLARLGGSFEDWQGDRPGPWGEQRSTIHFTGDAHSTWPMLDHQTRFNVAEGNAGLPYVSHDIAGFQGGGLTPEMYVRWVQAATFWPILRLHSSKLGVVKRLPWEFEGRTQAIAAEFLRLRGALVPYLYTLARETFDTGLPLTRGMYLEWPEHDEAYELDKQFMLGDLLVAPVGTPGDPAEKRVWIPPGKWIDVFTGERHTGPAVAKLSVPLERIPVFARAGAILPRAPYMDYSSQNRLSPVELDVYAVRSGEFSLYEDAGEGFEYQRGAFARTALRWEQQRRTLTIGRADGRYPGQLRSRAYRVRLIGVSRPRTVTVGGRRTRGWSYARAHRTLTIRTRSLPTSRAAAIRLRAR